MQGSSLPKKMYNERKKRKETTQAAARDQYNHKNALKLTNTVIGRADKKVMISGFAEQFSKESQSQTPLQLPPHRLRC